MPNRGFFFDLSDSIENNANVHRELIAQIEQSTKRNLVCYFGNAAHPGGAMQDHDPDLLENILRSMNLDGFGRKLDLMVNSPGGFPYAAGKMARVCRTFSKEFRAIVLGRAMSAATLLCLGADELLMTGTASLGPIDPQMLMNSAKGQRLVPATVIIETFRQMLGAAQQAIAAKAPPDPFLHVLDTIDATAIFESTKAIEATKRIAKELLATGLLRSSPAGIDKAVTSLIAEGEKELHGKHLYPDVVKAEIGLPVNLLPPGTGLDPIFRELFVRMEMYANRKGVAKYLVNRDGGIEVNVQVLQQG